MIEKRYGHHAKTKLEVFKLSTDSKISNKRWMNEEIADVGDCIFSLILANCEQLFTN